MLLCGLVLLPLVAETQYLVPDSSGHVAWVRSLLWDQDVDFANDYARFGSIEREGAILFGARTPAGHAGNPFGMGSALLWMPCVLAGALVAWIAAAVAHAGVATDGFGTLILQSVALGSWGWAIAAAALVASTLRFLAPRFGWRAEPTTDGSAALRTALCGACLGTPLIYYVLQMPSYSHACSAFTAALLLRLGVAWESEWTPRRALALGAVVGLAALVRVQDVVLAVIPAGLALRGRAARPRALALFAGAALMTFAPQLAAWGWIYGSPLRVPQGEGFLQLSASAALGVLAGTRHGLLVWSPVVLLALLGLVAVVRNPPTHSLGVVLLVAFGIEWLLNALPLDWWAGWAYGARRFTSCIPLSAVGLLAIARGRAGRAAIGLATVGSLVQWLRLASGRLSGEADPGWNGLWGGGFWGFWPELPASLWRLVARPWTDLQVLRRPQSTPPDLHADPSSVAWVLWGLWAIAMIALATRWLRPKSQ
jgi:hypothetical protein